MDDTEKQKNILDLEEQLKNQKSLHSEAVAGGFSTQTYLNNQIAETEKKIEALKLGKPAGVPRKTDSAVALSTSRLPKGKPREITEGKTSLSMENFEEKKRERIRKEIEEIERNPELQKILQVFRNAVSKEQRDEWEQAGFTLNSNSVTLPFHDQKEEAEGNVQFRLTNNEQFDILMRVTKENIKYIGTIAAYPMETILLVQKLLRNPEYTKLQLNRTAQNLIAAQKNLMRGNISGTLKNNLIEGIGNGNEEAFTVESI